ncbi:hypothetical protein ACE01N_03350 [Saccharicrinis sp. FJH2]|uniref:hypothetical protein n=1 Tax=Saccharicrinis sp. FJH65 TaxID=3344659 RepID=UPI0035F36F6A
MNNTTQHQIFFHVGTGKTGTTFLQYRVFPKLRNIYYIQRTRYKKVKKIIARTAVHKILISREFDQQLEKEIAWFTESYPDTTPVIVFRRHDSYIASQYRRFVKNGFSGTFSAFFDLESDKGYFKHSDLNYSHQVELLKTYFDKEPVVLLYDDLRNDPKGFIRKLAKIMDAEIDTESVDYSRKHRSYSEKQLKVIRSVAKSVNLTKRRKYKSGLLNFFWRIGLGTLRYSLLFLAKIVPSVWIDPKPFIDPKELEKVKLHFSQDWDRIKKISS